MGISIWQLLIILLIVVLLFGSKKLAGLGSDLGKAMRGFKKESSNDEASSSAESKRLSKDDAEFSADQTDHETKKSSDKS